MTTDQIREKFLDFFKAKPRNHKLVSAAPLVLENDPTTLFNSSGMQQLIPYLTGEKHPEGKRLVNSQPSIRTQDIEEVGDTQHTTYFEMLGNWSLGDYFKEEQLTWFWEFLTKELGLKKNRLWVTVFEGNGQVPKDNESAKIWKKIGVDEKRIHFYGVEENWWSRSGTPKNMPVGEIGGPDSEVFFEFTQVPHNPKYGKSCHPACNCGRFLEIGNSVFIQYKKKKDGSLEELPQKNVDFGGGLERLSAAASDNFDVFSIDVFKGVISTIEKFVGVKYGQSDEKDKAFRIIADHLRGASYLIADGVEPSNKLQGYILRRLIRRSVFKLRSLGFEIGEGAVSTFAKSFREDSETITEKWPLVKDTLNIEAVKFEKALGKGMKKLEKAMSSKEKVGGKLAFDLYQTDGFPFELTLEILEENSLNLSTKEKKEFTREFEIHRKKSRTAGGNVFKGGLADTSKETTKLHTTTHLLHGSLRRVLGKHVEQKGSNVTAERLRFDFSHPKKMADKEIKKVEEMINEQIEKDLPVSFETMTFKKAKQEGALAFFEKQYGEKVKVYSIGDFSIEVCGGPHVAHTGSIGRVRIMKEESAGAGVRRIYAEVIPVQ